MSSSIFIFLNAAVLAYGLLGGVFLAFSDFIMRALFKTSRSGGIEVMQNINREVFRWIFMTLFLCMTVVSLCLIAFGFMFWTGAASMFIALTGVTYFIGCFVVTASFNVPMNQTLAGMDTNVGTTKNYWIETYVPCWTFWNTVRALACVSAASFLQTGLTLHIGG